MHVVHQQPSASATALKYAVMSGRTDIVELFLSLNCDFTIKNDDTFSPFLVAAQLGFADCSEILLKRGANVGVTTVTEQTANHLAAAGGHTAWLEILLNSGADAGAVDLDGKTALMYATEVGIAACIELLS